MINSEEIGNASAGVSILREILKHFELNSDVQSSVIPTLNIISGQLSALRQANSVEFESRYNDLRQSISTLKVQLSNMKPIIDKDMDGAFQLLTVRYEDGFPKSMEPQEFLEHAKKFLTMDIEKSFAIIVKEAAAAVSRVNRQIKKADESHTTLGPHQ